jgi:hypothetical protein
MKEGVLMDGQAGGQTPKDSGKIKEAIWTNADLDVLEFLVAKKARSYVFGWITILSAIVAVGALIGWSGISSIQDSLNKKAEELDKQAQSLEEKAKQLDQTIEKESSQLTDRFRSLTQEQETILNDFRSHQDEIVQASREDQREIRRSTDTTRESVFLAQQALFNSQRELVASVREIRDNLDATKTSADEARKARDALQDELENTRQITARVAELEKEVLQYRDQIVRTADQIRPGGSPGNPGGPQMARGAPEISGVERERMRPAMGGDSIGGKTTLAQTFGCLVKDRGGDLYILTMAGSLEPGDDILQPGPLDGGKVETDVIAKVERRLKTDVSRPNQVIGVLAKVLDPSLVSAEIRGIGKLRGTAEPRIGATVRKAGRTTGVTTGRITDIAVLIRIATPEGSAEFRGLIGTERMTDGGDSGSILVDEDNNAVGISFAGSPSQSLFIPIQKVLDALGVTLVTEI